ncbi:hypothetical protein FRC17_005703 [Serendipita sp. 399]|nr:hypothetical protein FRC17_005703 [Serendipita sp. 399]
MQRDGSPTTPTTSESVAFTDADDTLFASSSGDDDTIAQGLAQLEQLRRNIKNNLMLRPLSTQNLREAAGRTSLNAESSSSHQIPGSYPFTPSVYSEQPLSAASTSSDVFYSARPLSSASVSSYYFEDQQMNIPDTPGSATFMPPGSYPKTPFIPTTERTVPALNESVKPRVPKPELSNSEPHSSTASTLPILSYAATDFLEILQPLNYPSASELARPLLLDTRPAGSYLASRVIFSINLAIPSLILKRHRRALQKGGAGFPSLDALKSYISTDAGRRNWAELMGRDDDSHGHGTSMWNGEIIIFDDEMDETDPMAIVPSTQSGSTPTSANTSNISTSSAAAWMLITLIRPLTSGSLYYLKGGITALRRLEGSEEVVVSGEWEIEDDDGSDGVDGEGSDAAASSDAQSTTTPPSLPSSRSYQDGMNSTPRASEVKPGSARLASAEGQSTPNAKLAASPNLKLANGSPNPRGPPQGLFTIRTDVAAKHKPLPEIEPPTTSPKLADMPDVVNGAASSVNGSSLSVKTVPVNQEAVGSSITLMPPPSPRRAKTLSDVGSLEPNKTPKLLTLNIPTAESKFANRDGERKGHSRNTSGSSDLSAKTPPSAVHLKQSDPRAWAHGPQSDLSEGRRPSAVHISTLTGHSDATAQSSQQGGIQGIQQPARPQLARLDMTSTERLKSLAQIEGRAGPQRPNLGLDTGGPPKLQLRTVPARAHTIAESPPPPLGGGPKLKIQLDKLNTTHQSNVLIVNTPSSPENSTSFVGNNAGGEDRSYMPPPSPSGSQFTVGGLGAYPPRPRTPKSPLTPLLPPSPMTARPGGPEPTSPAPVFTISTILPNFLYLGPELIKPEHASELEGLGVKRILNIAIECDDDCGLNLRDRFKYVRIPMRDTVEEVNVAKAMKEVCDILDDARLHSAPTYVHCKAGKSRSVTAVMAYLIHANHWTLSRAYAFVLDRRKGISPNIGFVSELMNFEEEELGGKSVGVVGGVQATGVGASRRVRHHPNHSSKPDGASTARRRPAHLRESMPPIVQSYSAIATVGEHDTFSGSLTSGYHAGGLGVSGEMPNGQLMSAGVIGVGGPGQHQVSMRDVGEEMEVRDAEGRYRHARRAPVDELTLQPVRRVSKAGLETWSSTSG